MEEERKFNYFYKIENTKDGKFYYGVHKTDNLNDDYFGSGIRLEYAINKHGKENFKKENLIFFNTYKQALDYEGEFVDEKLLLDPSCYNLKKGGIGGWAKKLGIVSVKDASGNHSRVSINDPRYVSGELIHNTKNLVTVKDSLGNTCSVNINDPRYLSGELIHLTKNQVTVRDVNGNTFNVDKTDPRWISGEVKSINKGKTRYRDINGKTYFLDTHDNLIKELNLVSCIKDKVICKDKDGNCFFVDRTDERYLSGELICATKGLTCSEETRRKISVTCRLKNLKGSNSPNFGCCWIYNEELKQNKRIKQQDVEGYLNLGWKEGLKYRDDNKFKCLIHNDELKENKLVRKEEIEFYLKSGWYEGRKNEYKKTQKDDG